MAADDFNWDDDNGFDDGKINKKNEDSDEFEKTVDHDDNAFLDEKMEIPKIEKPEEPDSGGAGDFPFSDIDDALAGVDVPAEPVPEPEADEEEEQEPGELTSVSPPLEPETGTVIEGDNGLVEMGPDAMERAADVDMYDLNAEEPVPSAPSQSPSPDSTDNPFDPFVPASDQDEAAETDPPRGEEEIMELEPEVLVSSESPADEESPVRMEMVDEPLELDQKSEVPPQPAPETAEEALSLEPELMSLGEDIGPMAPSLAGEGEEIDPEEDFIELGSETMVPSEEPGHPQASSPRTDDPVEPQPIPDQSEPDESGLQLDSLSDQEPSMAEQKGDDVFLLDEHAEPSPAPAKGDAFEIEGNEFGGPPTPQPLESEPVAPVEQQEAVQADYTDMVVSNQDFLDIDEQGGAPPPTETKTKESQNLIDDKDLPNISTEKELVDYTTTSPTGRGDKAVQTKVVDGEPAQPAPQGPEPGTKPIDEEDSGKFYRSDFTSEPETSKGIPPKLVMYGGIGLAAVIIIAVLFLVVFKGKDKTAVGEDGQQQQITQGKKPTGLRSQNMQDRRYNKYMREARKFYKQGMYDEAEKNVQLALKNKRTVEANNLLKDISQQTQELKKKEEMDKIQKAGEQLLKKAEEKEAEPKMDPEEEDYQNAMKKGTIEAMEAFLAKYNEESRHYFQVYRKVRDLKAESTRKTKEEIKTRGQQIRRAPLRSRYLQLNQLAVEKKIGEMPMISNQFVTYTIGKDKVIVDYGTGLMWHLWNKPMNSGNSRLFSARRLAGYSNWRLPTIEELYSARRMNLRSLRSTAKARAVVWSGDRDYQGSKTVWALEFPTGKLIPAAPETTYYLCAVRSIR